MEITPAKASPNKNRWAILGRQSLLAKLDTDGRQPQKSGQWEEFDHSKSLILTHSGTACIAFRKVTYERVVLKHCEDKYYSPERKFLVDIGRVNGNIYFISTLYTFKHREKSYVASELSDISLADLIDCTMRLDEINISTILGQVLHLAGPTIYD